MAVQEAQIRQAKPSDIPALRKLLNSYYSEGSVEQIDDDSALIAYTGSSPFGFTIAEIGDHLVGCVLSRQLTSIPAAIECKRLYVAPEARGHGIANLLMDSVENCAGAASLRWVYLDSKDNFQTAIALYRRRGYETCERFNDNPEATIFLRKRLDRMRDGI